MSLGPSESEARLGHPEGPVTPGQPHTSTCRPWVWPAAGTTRGVPLHHTCHQGEHAPSSLRAPDRGWEQPASLGAAPHSFRLMGTSLGSYSHDGRRLGHQPAFKFSHAPSQPGDRRHLLSSPAPPGPICGDSHMHCCGPGAVGVPRASFPLSAPQ